MIKVNIYGQLGADPVERQTIGRKQMATVTVAVDVARTGKKQDTIWVSVAAFGKQADGLLRHQKSDLAAFMGTLSRSTYTGRDGEARQSWQLTADSIVSARTGRPGGGRKRNEPSVAGKARRHNGSVHAPLDDEISF